MRKIQLLPSLAFFIMAQQTVCLAGRIQVGANRDKFPRSSSRSCYGKRGKWSVWKRGQPTIADMIMYILSLTLVYLKCTKTQRPRESRKLGYTKWQKDCQALQTFFILYQLASQRAPSWSLYIYASRPFPANFVGLSPSLSNLFITCRT